MLIVFLFLVPDESMSGWCPKTSNLGGLQNCTHDPRKSVLLGAMLKNTAECNAGTIFYNAVVQNPEQQSRKKFSKDKKKSLRIKHFSS